MARVAVFRRCGEISQFLRARMASLTFHARMFAIQFERKAVVIESLAKAICPIVTAETVRTISCHMRLYKAGIVLAVTILASRLIERFDTAGVAILTCQRREIKIPFVTSQRKAQTIVRKLLAVHVHQ